MRSIQIALVLALYLVALVVGQAENTKIPAELLAKALNHASQSDELDAEIETTIRSLRYGDINTLYKVAKSMNKAGDGINSVLIWHKLADGDAHHILSMVSLGFTYSEEDKQQAIKYFVQAGEDGPHQSSLYNAGRLFVETNDYMRGLAYIRAAATFETNNKNAKMQMTQTATEAYHELSRMMMAVDMMLQDIVDVFPYASIDGFPKEGSKEDKLWVHAMQKLEEYAMTKKQPAMQMARKDLSKLQNSKGLSKFQDYLLRGVLGQTLEMITDEL